MTAVIHHGAFISASSKRPRARLIHTCHSGTVGGYSGDASKKTAPPAANHSALRANGVSMPNSYQTRALVAHWIQASHG